MDADSDSSILDSDEEDDNIEDIEITYGDIRQQERIYVPKDQRRIPPIGSIFDKAKIIGIRAEQINSGADIFVNIGNREDGYLASNAIEIAELELKEGKCPIVIDKEYTMGNVVYIESFSANELSF